MLSSPTQRRAAVAFLAIAMTGAATDAFAIRNRYTNEQNEGFAALFLEAFGRPGFADDQPIYRGRRPLRGEWNHRSADPDEEPPAY